MTKKKRVQVRTHKKRSKPQKKPAAGGRGSGSDRLVFDRLDKIFAKLLILMGAFQAISLKLAHVRVFQHFFEVRYFDRFAGVGVMLIIIGLIVLLRNWVTRTVMRLLSVMLTIALLIQLYDISDLFYRLMLISRVESARGESSATVSAVFFTAVVFGIHAIVLMFADLNFLISGKYDGKEAILVFFKEKKDKKDGK